jgi:hypothetical protein
MAENAERAAAALREAEGTEALQAASVRLRASIVAQHLDRIQPGGAPGGNVAREQRATR